MALLPWVRSSQAPGLPLGSVRASSAATSSRQVSSTRAMSLSATVKGIFPFATRSMSASVSWSSGAATILNGPTFFSRPRRVVQ